MSARIGFWLLIAGLLAMGAVLYSEGGTRPTLIAIGIASLAFLLVIAREGMATALRHVVATVLMSLDREAGVTGRSVRLGLPALIAIAVLFAIGHAWMSSDWMGQAGLSVNSRPGVSASPGVAPLVPWPALPTPIGDWSGR